MSSRPADRVLDALLAELRPPAMSDGLAERVAAAALALPQQASAVYAAPRHARRWLRRPLLVGGAALGLAFTGAVAATFAGVELPRPVAAVIEKLPLVGKAPVPEPRPAPPLRRAVERPPQPAPQPKHLDTAPPLQPLPPLSPRFERRLDRLEQRQEIIAARRAAGLPTPGADRREARRERMREIVAARRAAGLPTPHADRMEAREARVRAHLEERRRQREAGESTLARFKPEEPET